MVWKRMSSGGSSVSGNSNSNGSGNGNGNGSERVNEYYYTNTSTGSLGVAGATAGAGSTGTISKSKDQQQKQKEQKKQTALVDEHWVNHWNMNGLDESRRSTASSGSSKKTKHRNNANKKRRLQVPKASASSVSTANAAAPSAASDRTSTQQRPTTANPATTANMKTGGENRRPSSSSSESAAVATAAAARYQYLLCFNTRQRDNGNNSAVAGPRRNSLKRTNTTMSVSGSASGIGGNGGSGSSNKKGFDEASRAVWIGRIVFYFVLFLVTFILGTLSFKLLYNAEMHTAERQLDAISQRAVYQAKDAVYARRWAGSTMATFVGDLYPNASQWPFVEWWNFEAVVLNILQTSHGQDMGFIPFVTLDQQSEFEEFAQDVYGQLEFPEQAGVSDPDVGFGIWARNTSVTPVQKYHDTTAYTPYGSPYDDILGPIFRTDEGFHPVLLFNPHSQPFTGNAIDNMISCSLKREEEYSDQVEQEKAELQAVGINRPLSVPPHQCGVITDIFWNVKLGGKWSVANFFPIYPANDPLKIVGYIPSIVTIEELLRNVFSKTDTGIDVVFETEGKTVSYTIIDGEVHFVAEGEVYDPNYEVHKHTLELVDASLYSNTTSGNPSSLVFSLYPNEQFFDVYTTDGPLIASVAVMASVLFTILIFVLYDFCVRREFHSKEELLTARRQFMRFVSHEVRTPLNAVSMGLDLMQSEIAQALGFENSSSYWVRRQSIPPASSSSMCANQSQDQQNVGISHHVAREWFELTQEIQGNAQGAVDILNDLLNYDKIEQGNLQLSFEVLSIWQLLEKSVYEFKLSAKSKDIRLSVSFGIQSNPDDQKAKDGDSDIENGKKNTAIFFPRSRDIPDFIQSLRAIGDSCRLMQVVRNLMSNAMKFTPNEGSVTVEVLFIPPPNTLIPESTSTQAASESCGNSQRSAEFVQSKHAKSKDLHPKAKIIHLDNDTTAEGYEYGRIKLCVHDSGPGLSADQLSELFQDGVQFNANELQGGGGTGLGLFIAKGIVSQHNGTLSASSDGLGHGTSFELELPLWRIEPDDSICEQTEEIKSSNLDDSPTADQDKKTTSKPVDTLSSHTNNAAPSLHILVVDDIKSNRKLLRRLLERRGHVCEEAENGLQAVEMTKAAFEDGHPYHSILLDYEMPVMDGPTAAREIRQFMSLQDQPAEENESAVPTEVETAFDNEADGPETGRAGPSIVGVTGNVLSEDVNYFLSCGADEVLSKPVKIQALVALWAEVGIEA